MTISLPQIQIATSYCIYDGPSRLTGKRIIVIVTGLKNRSENTKTGEMVQTWIMAASHEPVSAHNKGLDNSVCGDCKHRHFGSCYVNLGMGPYGIWQKWKAGGYQKLQLNHATSELFRDRDIRLGSYGDPTAVPIEVWDCITKVCKSSVGYSHSWKHKKHKAYRRYCMASCDTLDEVRQAQSLRWKPFYVRLPDDPIPHGFFVCPASNEAGKRLTCNECKACKGGIWNRKQGLPTIVIHALEWKMNRFKQGLKLMKQKKKFIGVF